jgi:hypothetical protein
MTQFLLVLRGRLLELQLLLVQQVQLEQLVRRARLVLLVLLLGQPVLHKH